MVGNEYAAKRRAERNRWEVIGAMVLLAIAIGVVAMAGLMGCVGGKGWTRGDVAAAELQTRLDQDRAACEAIEREKAVAYQIWFGAVDVSACLQGRGWQKVD